ncbi:uncharacterized protein LOC134801115 [Cydia splendana]|uniref:uncharacterized protein LOC134801115 n=1 Tax=Cydia splendana TaxID=1100963 RepID=UPI0028F48520
MLRWFLLALGFYTTKGHYDPQLLTVGPEHDTRRILKGTEISDTRPYMVYLRPAKMTPALDPNWLCGGVIIHPRYILTSAACIEDVTHFYIVSGTHRWVPPKETTECIKHGAVKAIWKCVPKTYRFDGNQFDNIQWMANDIAVVMTAEPINFEKRVIGCDFIPQMIRFNNVSDEYEAPETSASVAGWGTTGDFSDPADAIDFGDDATTEIPGLPVVDIPKPVKIPKPVEIPKPDDIPKPVEIPKPDDIPKPEISDMTRSSNSVELMEADVEILSKDSCKSLWLPRYHDIIDQHMICGKNIFYDELHLECEEDQMECRELVYTPEDGGTVRRDRGRRFELKQLLQSLKRLKSLRRARQKSLRREGKEIGGFCENDHGGPLITGNGKSSMVIGIISAYRTLNNSKRCVGPFLYTSVFNNRHLINCAINRQLGKQCRTVLRDSSTVLDQEHINWGRTYKDGRSENSKKKKHHGKRKSRNSNRTIPRYGHHMVAVKLVQNDRKINEYVKENMSEALLSGQGVKENMAEAFLSGQEVNEKMLEALLSGQEVKENMSEAFFSGQGVKENMTEAFIFGQGVPAYNMIRRHVPPRKRRGRARLGRRGSASVVNFGKLRNHSSIALPKEKSLKSRN